MWSLVENGVVPTNARIAHTNLLSKHVTVRNAACLARWKLAMPYHSIRWIRLAYLFGGAVGAAIGIPPMFCPMFC